MLDIEKYFFNFSIKNDSKVGFYSFFLGKLVSCHSKILNLAK
jgi:hypothetical protein